MAARKWHGSFVTIGLVLTIISGFSVSLEAGIFYTTPADLDVDGDVDLTDFGCLQACLGDPVIWPADPTCREADLDLDGAVDVHDVDKLKSCMSGSAVLADSACLGVNHRPRIALTQQQTLTHSGLVVLRAVVADDALPISPGSVEVHWRKVSGPGNVLFTDSTRTDTTAVFDEAGEYELELSATDGELSNLARLTCTVAAGIGDALPMFTASRASGMGPLAVFFDAINPASGVVQPADGDHARPHYQWDFGDDPAAIWSTNGRSRNQAIGYVAGHVFDNPGTYSVTLTVTTVDGHVYRYQQNITVEPFDGTTYYVSSSIGHDGYDGQSPTQPFQSVAKALSKAAPNTRILFKRGDRWSTSTTTDMTAAGPGLIGAYYCSDGSDEPTQPKPQFTHAGPNDFLRFFSSARNWRICDLELIGLAPTGCGIEGFTTLHENLIYRVSSTGFGAAFLYSVAYYDHDQNFIVDCDWTGTGGRGVYLGGKRGALLGNYGHHVGEHVLRVWHSQRYVISDNILHDPAPGHSHAIKLHNKPGTYPPSEYVIVSGNSFRGDQWAATFGPQNTTLNELVRKLIVERNLVTVQDDGRELIGISVWGPDIVIRNNAINGTGTNGSYYRAVSIERRGIGPVPYRVRVYNNTAYRADGPLTMCILDGTTDDTIVKNNLIAVGSSYVDSCFLIEGGSAITNANLILPAVRLFTDPLANDFSLLPGTAPIDTGEKLPCVSEDYRSDYRPIDGNADGEATIDVGAHEWLN